MSSSTSSYRRYAPGRNDKDDNSTAARHDLSSAGDAKTTGTSWTSLRFTKPSLPEDYRGHSSRLASKFESTKTSPAASTYSPSVASTTSRYSAASSCAPASASAQRPSSGTVRSALANYQKAVAATDRVPKTRSTVAGPLMTYRSQVARDMFSPTRYVPSRERPPKELETVKPSSLAASYLNEINDDKKSTYSGTSSRPGTVGRSLFSPTRGSTVSRENDRSLFSPTRPSTVSNDYSRPSTVSHDYGRPSTDYSRPNRTSTTSNDNSRSLFSPSRTSTVSNDYSRPTTVSSTDRNRSIFSPPRNSTTVDQNRSIFSPTRGLPAENRSIFSPPKETPYSSTRSTSTGRPYSTTYQPPLSRVTSSSLVSNPPRRPTSEYGSDPVGLSVTKALNKPIAREDRPWRQKMADAARLRSVTGHENTSTSSGIVSRLAQSRASRRNSQTSGDELQQSLNMLKNIVAEPDRSLTGMASRYRSRESRDSSTASIPSVVTTRAPDYSKDRAARASFVSGNSVSPVQGGLRPYRTSGYGQTLAEAQTDRGLASPSSLLASARPSEMGQDNNVMSRSYSPIRTSGTLFGSPRSSVRYASSENVSALPPVAEPLYKDKGQTIMEEIQERFGDGRKFSNPRSSKERTLRRSSRQRSQSKDPPKSSSTSSDEDTSSHQPRSRTSSRDPPKRRKLRKRTPSLPKNVEKTASLSQIVVSPGVKRKQVTNPAEVDPSKGLAAKKVTEKEPPFKDVKPPMQTSPKAAGVAVAADKVGEESAGAVKKDKLGSKSLVTATPTAPTTAKLDKQTPPTTTTTVPPPPQKSPQITVVQPSTVIQKPVIQEPAAVKLPSPGEAPSKTGQLRVIPVVLSTTPSPSKSPSPAVSPRQNSEAATVPATVPKPESSKSPQPKSADPKSSHTTQKSPETPLFVDTKPASVKVPFLKSTSRSPQPKVKDTDKSPEPKPEPAAVKLPVPTVSSKTIQLKPKELKKAAANSIAPPTTVPLDTVSTKKVTVTPDTVALKKDTVGPDTVSLKKVTVIPDTVALKKDTVEPDTVSPKKVTVTHDTVALKKDTVASDTVPPKKVTVTPSETTVVQQQKTVPQTPLTVAQTQIIAATVPVVVDTSTDLQKPQTSQMGNSASNQSAKSPSKPSALQRVLAPFRRKTATKPLAIDVQKEVKKVPMATEESISDTVSVSMSEATTTNTVTYVDDDESKYNAVTEFNPKKKKKNEKMDKELAVKPVPGTWHGVSDEINISCNRRLTRRAVSNLAVEALLKDTAFLKAVPKRFKQPIKKKKQLLEERTIAVVLVNKPKTKENVAKIVKIKKPLLIYKASAKYSVPKPKKTIKPVPVPVPVPVSAVAVLNQEIACNKNLKSKLSVEKTVKQKPVPLKIVIKLDCNSSKESVRNANLNIRRREDKRAANVTVIAVDVMDVNFAKISKKFQAIVDKKKLAEIIEKQFGIIRAEKERLSRTPVFTEDDFSSCSEASRNTETRAKRVLNEIRNSEPKVELVKSGDAHLPLEEDYIRGGPIILPDKSILENYVKRKRGELERLHSESTRSPSTSIRGETPSPCPSTASELLLPSSVKIIEPKNKSLAHISSPQRQQQIGESVSLPGSNRNSRMIELLPYPPNFEATVQNVDNGNPVSGFKASIRRPIPRREDKLNVQNFDMPKSPFEAALQSQAAALAKKASFTSTLSDGDSQENILSEGGGDNHRRRPSTDSTHSMPPISGSIGQGFMQAATAQPRHERYAAHIPVRQTSVDNSGRQSTTSIDSGNSGVLDTATKQLDQMIDQARYRHHQHRSKFKEAIDYLDQIFEDLKKEVDPPTSRSSEKKPEQPVAPAKGIQAAKAVFQKQVQQPQIQIPPQTTNVPIVRLRKPDPARQQQQPSQSSQSPQRQQPQPQGQMPPQKGHQRNGSNSGLITKPQIAQNLLKSSNNHTSGMPTNASTSQNFNQGPKPFPKLENNDIEVSETIVLPTKSNPEKMDFTRQWLSGDIKKWADKPDLAGDITSPNDSDDRSVGSCSAEVAAINAADRRKNRRAHNGQAPAQTTQDAPKTTAQSKPAGFGGFNGQQKQQPVFAKPKVGVPVKPQPIRPQPQYAPFPTNGQLLNAAIEPTLHKVPSHEYISAIQRAHQERAGSQDYQSIGSVHSQEGYKPPPSFNTNSLNRYGAFQQYPQRGSVHSLPDATLNGQQQQQQHQRHYNSIQQDPILAIDALVAELELNTESDRNDKRRSFPTSVNDSAPIHQNAGYRAPAPRSIASRNNNLNVQQPDRLNGGSIDRGMRRLQMQQRSSLDEMANMLTNVAGDLSSAKPHTSTSFRGANRHPQQLSKLTESRSGSGTKPFETINHEKIAPSRVGAMQQMFETKNTTNGNDWRSAKNNNSKEEENYYEIQEYSQHNLEKPNIVQRTSSPLKSPRLGSVQVYHQQQHQPLPHSQSQQYHGSFPLPSLPTVPPPILASTVSSTNSSQHGGYYSSSTSSIGKHNGSNNNNVPTRHSSFKHSLSSRAQSFDDDDDGFYDNINVDVDSRRYFDGDNVSLASHQLPPTHSSSKNTGKLGQLIRRIGGGGHNSSSSKAPVNTSSSVSLNKMGIDGHGHQHHNSSRAPLMKSNSLSGEPWQQHAMDNGDRYTNFGQKLKQSIFGSKKRVF